MRTSTLLARNLRWFWRTNLAVLLGVATATGVLGGALLVGVSVRASLRTLVLDRLGNADYVVTRNGFFSERLAAKVGDSCPLIALEGVATRADGGQRAYGVQVYGVDGRFWKFQGWPSPPPDDRAALPTPALARELGAKVGDVILLRIPKPSAIPLETLHGQKENAGETLRLTLGAAPAKEFSLRPQQGDVRALFVPLRTLQAELRFFDINAILVGGNRAAGHDAGAAGIAQLLKERFDLFDLGIRLSNGPRCMARGGGGGGDRQPLSSRQIALRPDCRPPSFQLLETDSALIGGALEQAAMSAAKSLNVRAEPVLAYLANTIRSGAREIPYSVVAALDPAMALAPTRDDGITLSEWAARDLGAKAGDPATLEYYVWNPDGSLQTETAAFHVERIVRVAGDMADRELTPSYPGITESRSMSDWDPPFPLDMKRVRPADEKYWDDYGPTPKAFIRLARGRQLWGTRFGSLTSIRIAQVSPDFGEALRAAIDPAKAGMTVIPLKAQGLQAAQGSTDFGEYFLYFSFFLVISALLLAGLFFKLGIEQRTREIGVLRALGFPPARIRRLFVLEGAALSVVGAAAGVGAALGYCALVLAGLRTWWFDAVGSRLISLHASAPPLAIGAAAGVLAGLASVAWTLRSLQPATPRSLIAGDRKPVGQGPWPALPMGGAEARPRSSPERWRWIAGAASALCALALAWAAIAGKLDQAGGFFGSGSLLLIGGLLFQSAWLHSRALARVGGLISLGLRNAAYRPGRSILCIALIASATFVIASLDAFRRGESSAGLGGFPLLADSELPLVYDPNTEAGRSALNLPAMAGVEFVPFRVRPGDDASCLNLYQPRNPRILAPPPGFLRSAHFAFQDAVARTPNPWLLLERGEPGSVIPAIADANSMTYSLHLKLGEEFELNGVRYRIVAALQDSLFQGELLISETNFLRLFPDSEGFRFFLLSAPPGKAGEVARTLEDSLSDYGFDVQPTESRLAGFHKVENTYLSTFRALGGLGLALGVVGLAAILLRNVLERRKELALLRAVGYRPRHIAAMVLAENALLLLLGLGTGAVCAALAVAPAVSARGGHAPLSSLAMLLALVMAAGVAASVAATALALRAPLLEALRSE